MGLLAILVPLLLGVGIGNIDVKSDLLRQIERFLSHSSLILLLTLMGTKIGSDNEILTNISKIGFQSLLLAFASIIGSLLLVKIVSIVLKETSGVSEDFEGVTSKISTKFSSSIVLSLGLGIFLGSRFIPDGLTPVLEVTITYTLGVLLFAVGISLGLNKKIFAKVTTLGWGIVLLPISIAIGSILGPMLFGLFLKLSVTESAAVGAGFGWYSLSGVLLTKLHSPELGAIAFLTNIFRELLTFLILPFTARYLGKLPIIAPGGATTMDVTLPLLKEIGGEEVILPGFFSGAVLTSLVPLVVPLIIRI
ncbi:MAG: lysine exporter LysO family protein [Candidatus Bipolaricaulia bacterium]